MSWAATTPYTLCALAVMALASGCTKAEASQPSRMETTREAPGGHDATPDPLKASAAAARVTTVLVNEDGFSPNHVEIGRGAKATLQFRRTTEQTCATSVAFPELDITKKLPLNETVSIEIPTDKVRTLTFQCGMGMYRSKVVIL